MRNIIFDENIAPKLALAIYHLAHKEKYNITSVVAEFGYGATDREWLTNLSTLDKIKSLENGKEIEIEPNSWIIITCDRRIKTRKHELEAFKKSNNILVIMPACFSKNYDFWDKTAFLLRWWKMIVKIGNKAGKKTTLTIPGRWTPKEFKY